MADGAAPLSPSAAAAQQLSQAQVGADGAALNAPAEDDPPSATQMLEMMKAMKKMEAALLASNATIAALQNQANTTATPASVASSSTRPSQPAAPPSQPDAGWQDVFEGMAIEWGDMDQEQLRRLQYDKTSRKAFKELWSAPSNKKIRKFDHKQQALLDIADYKSSNLMDHPV
jgi:hypothetical protein